MTDVSALLDRMETMGRPPQRWAQAMRRALARGEPAKQEAEALFPDRTAPYSLTWGIDQWFKVAADAKADPRLPAGYREALALAVDAVGVSRVFPTAADLD